MVIGVQILLLIVMISISATLTQVNLVNGTSENNSTSSGTSAKNKDIFALLQLERDVAKAEGSLKELHSGKKNPFDLLGEVKNEGKFKPESGSFLPEYDDTAKDNNN
jgi:uncharacterized protein YpuA (DUF1002 family)